MCVITYGTHPYGTIPLELPSIRMRLCVSTVIFSLDMIRFRHKRLTRFYSYLSTPTHIFYNSVPIISCYLLLSHLKACYRTHSPILHSKATKRDGNLIGNDVYNPSAQTTHYAKTQTTNTYHLFFAPNSSVLI